MENEITTQMRPDDREKDRLSAPIGSEQIRKFYKILKEYDAGKGKTKERIRASENWWRMRNTYEETVQGRVSAGHRSSSGWLCNVIINKHADAMEAYPEPNILPREAGDRNEARILSAIIPCVLEQNGFEKVYSDAWWQKLKTGTGVYKVTWDKNRLGGLGDISIEQVNLLNIYWEPGIKDIQKSRYFFHTELWDRDILREMYPDKVSDRVMGKSFIDAKFLEDEYSKDSEKACVIDVYYHKYVKGKKTLQFCKFVDDIVLYATENETEPLCDMETGAVIAPPLSETGLYDHAKYPYVFDVLYPIEGSPCGDGYIDRGASSQTEIDILKTCIVKGAVVRSIPRYLTRADGNINEEQFLDLTNPLIKVAGNVDEATLRAIDPPPVDGNAIAVLDRSIEELRETSGNTETATGSVPSGVTAASAVAALQEASGKGSRDSISSGYRAFGEIVEFCIELIRQFYTVPRKFRILGDMGKEDFVLYDNASIRPRDQGSDYGTDLGFYAPVFDVRISAQKKNVYTKVSQNELALQFFKMGFFNPQMTDQALCCLDLMEFDGKDIVMQKVSRNRTMFDKLLQYMQMALLFARKCRPDMVQGIAADLMLTQSGNTPAGLGGQAKMVESDHIAGLGKEENTIVTNARERSRSASQPEGGKVIKEGSN